MKRINWKRVDPLLGGDLTALAARLGVSQTTLKRRRRALGLPTTPRGRPLGPLTTVQQTVVTAIAAGQSVSEVARRRGTSRTAVNKARRGAERKRAIWDAQCPQCQGRGVVPCGAQNEPKCRSEHHYHTCRTCEGKGTT